MGLVSSCEFFMLIMVESMVCYWFDWKVLVLVIFFICICIWFSSRNLFLLLLLLKLNWFRNFKVDNFEWEIEIEFVRRCFEVSISCICVELRFVFIREEMFCEDVV